MAGLHDMAQMTVSGAPGTGTITLGSAVSGPRPSPQPAYRMLR